ncbi:MAG: hypothetical protein Q8761_03110, partial [Sweet potato little leaf phytoplasma]|nr:hypothetical protein [Sweet potato little leaf phytoplasma]
LELQSVKKEGSEGLFVKGKSKNQGNRHQVEDKNKAKIKCNYCHEEGHIKRDCYSLKRKNNQNKKFKKNKQSEAAVGENSITYSDALATSDHCSDEQEYFEKYDWVIDSGCSFHMTPTKGWFSTYREWDSGIVYMGNNNTCRVIGIGSVSLKLKDGTVKLLRNVRHVPNLKRNLISLGMLDSIGCTYGGSGGTLEIKKDQKTVLVGPKINGLYVLEDVEMVHSA